MSRLHLVLPFLVLACIAPSGLAGGEPPALVRDLRFDLPPNRRGVERVEGAVDFQDRTYFVVVDEQHGQELWVSDGTAEGTALFLDVCSGPCSSRPGPLVAADDRLFFFASDGISGAELWSTDGTAGGTGMAADLCPGPCGWRNVQALALGPRVIFFGESEALGYPKVTLGASDGTVAGSVVISVSDRDLSYRLGTRLGDVVLFGQDGDLWSTDGTVENTRPVVALGASSGSPTSLGTVGDRAFFTLGSSLFVTDGTATGTKELALLDPPVLDLVPASGSPVLVDPARAFVDLGGTAYFFVDGYVRYAEERICTVWRSDGTPAGTALVTRLLPKGRTRCPLTLLSHRGLLFTEFIANPGQRLWVSDGTALGSRFLGPPHYGALVPFGDHVYFQSGEDLWRSDGTADGTKLYLEDLRFLLLSVSRDRLFLRTLDAEEATELFSTDDGTPESTHTFAEVPLRFSSSDPTPFADLGGRLFFTATGDEGEKIRTVDVATASDLEVFLEDDDGEIFGPGRLPDAAVFGGELAINVDGLVISDGSAASTRTVGGALTSAGGLTAVGSELYFAGYTEAASSEPWRSDGTEPGTLLLRDIVPGGDMLFIAPPILGGSNPAEVTPLGDLVVFVADKVLWKTDGTPDGTVPVADLASGGPENPADLEVLGSLLLFAATGADGRELWVSDGSAEGTRQLVDLAPGPASSHPSDLKELCGFAYFATGNPDFEGRLWKTDGTAAGTSLVLDLAAWGAPRIERLTVAGSRFFFVAATSLSGSELWVSDGTPGGTRLVADLFPGPASSDPRSLTAVGAAFLFSANDGVTGAELWLSDGTPGGTRLLSDLAAGPRSSLPGSLHVAGSRVFFAAATARWGRELWSAVPISVTDGSDPGAGPISREALQTSKEAAGCRP